MMDVSFSRRVAVLGFVLALAVPAADAHWCGPAGTLQGLDDTTLASVRRPTVRDRCRARARRGVRDTGAALAACVFCKDASRCPGKKGLLRGTFVSRFDQEALVGTLLYADVSCNVDCDVTAENGVPRTSFFCRYQCYRPGEPAPSGFIAFAKSCFE